MTNIESVKMEIFTRESWSLLRGHARRKKQAGDIVLPMNQMTFVKSLRLSMVVMRRNFTSIGPKGLGGLAVEQMRGWIGDVIIMARALNRVLVTIAGELALFSFFSFFDRSDLVARMGKPLPNKIYNEDSASRFGLELRRGPHPRSYHAGIAAIATTGRSVLGMDP